MIKVTEETIKHMEQNYPGITEQIQRFEAMELPACPTCGSTDTASVHVGIVGRAIHLAGATSKFHLIPNGNDKGIYFCNVCRQQFGPSRRQDNYPEDQTERARPIFLRPEDDSWQAYRDWVLGLTSALTGRAPEDHYSEAQWIQHAREFWLKAKENDEL